MKRYFIIVLLLIGGIAWSQKDTTFYLQKDYDLLIVEEGWNVRLTQTADYNTLGLMRLYEEYEQMAPLNRIVVYSEDNVAASKVFSLKDGVLKLKKNTSLPQGTKVEIFTAQRLGQIELKPHAVLTTGRLEGYGDLTIAQYEQSRFVADTLASHTVLLGYKGDSCYFYCNLIEADNIVTDQNRGHCYGKTPIPKEGSDYCSRAHYRGSVDRIMPMLIEVPDVKFNDDRFSPHLGIGARMLFNTEDNDVFNHANNAFFCRRYNLSASVYGKWKLNRRWDVKSGLQFDWYCTPFYSSDNDFFGDSLAIGQSGADPAPAVNGRFCSQVFVGVPLSITYHPIYRKPQALGISAGLVPSVGFSPTYYVRTNSGEKVHSRVTYPNPFRLEARLGIETNVLGIIHGLQFYVNLLPVYRGVPDAGKYRELGIAIAF